MTRSRRSSGWPPTSSALTSRTPCWRSRDAGCAGRPGRSARASSRCPTCSPRSSTPGPSIALSIELHPRIYDLPIYDPRWLGFFPDLRPESLAAVVRLAAECERRYADGSLRRPEVVEAIPWPGRDLDWLASSLGYLRSVVPTLIESACDPAATTRPLQPARPAHHDRDIPPKSSRIVSLDQFRGYTVVGMLLVNFIGGYQVVPAVLKHRNTYCSYADTIMPQFFFAVGFAYRLTFLRRLETVGTRAAILAVLKRVPG